MQGIPEVFKYNSVISVPLFALIALFLIRRTKNFSFSLHTVSKSILYLSRTKHKIIFRLNFILKALLDFGFFLFLIDRFNISWKTPLPWIFVVETTFFASLAYFVEGKYSLMHKIVAYISGVAWTICEFYLAYATGNTLFILFTYGIAIVSMGIAFGTLVKKKTNVFIQIISMLILYSWVLAYVFTYL